jgi:hypothetical protein
VVSLSWDKAGLIENWKTRELNGQVTSLRIADLDGTGKKQLILSMLLAKDTFKEAKSVIFAYDLNVRAEQPKKPADENETVPLQAENPKKDQGGLFKKKGSQ